MAENNSILIRKLKQVISKLSGISESANALSDLPSYVVNTNRDSITVRLQNAIKSGSGTYYSYGTLVDLTNVVITKFCIFGATNSLSWDMYINGQKISFSTTGGEDSQTDYPIISFPLKCATFKVDANTRLSTRAFESKLYVEYIPLGG
ncbi:MAG: hypothetical protein UC390_07625 [Peptococcaceae bacterium]|nr:hypothetical protein [Peptococcaceae bacterium]